MDKENLFQEYTSTYRNCLYGSSTFNDTYKIIEKINSTVHEVENIEAIESLVRLNNERLNKIEEEVKAKYYRDIVYPLVDELLDFLQFEGLVKSIQYKKRAEELKEKLQKYDGLFLIRGRALKEFFLTERGSEYTEYEKIKLVLKLGSLDTRDL